MHLGRLLRRGIAEHHPNVAVSSGDATMTYADLDRDARRLANALLGKGLRPGDRVAVLLENRVEYAVVDVALAYAGLVRVALNVRLLPDDFIYIVQDCSARALVTQSRFDHAVALVAGQADLTWIRLDDEAGLPAGAENYSTVLGAASSRFPVVEVQPDWLAWISYTSGTTGRPKGVMLSHRALAHVALNLMLELGTETTSDSILLVQPLSHGAGYFMLAYLACGGRVHLRHGFDAEEVVALGKSERIRTLKLVPTMLLDMLEVRQTSNFESIIYGAAPISERVLENALDRYGSVLSQLYGQSEAPMTITYLPKPDHQIGTPQIRSAGRPWRSVHVEVIGDDGQELPRGALGEVVVTGQHMMSGYFGQPRLTAEVLRGHRVWTRDMGFMDEAGYLYLRGRRDEMINSGGFNIAPKEVEDVVTQFPGVREAVAMGTSHPRWGEAVQVYVTSEEGAGIDQDSLIDFCRPKLGFRRPQSVVVVPSMPRTSYGKIDRQRLLTEGAGE